MSEAITDVVRIKQYTASSGQVDFTIPFVILSNTADVRVYQRGASATPDDSADELTIGVDFTVTGAPGSGGTVTLTVGATAGDIVTICGDTSVARASYYTTDVTASGLNNDFEYQTIFTQFREGMAQNRVPTYPRSASITSYDLVLPNLGANQAWVMNDTGTGIGASDVITTPGAPIGASYIVQTASTTLSNEQVLGDLATGLLKNTTTTGVLTIAVDDLDYISSLAADTTPQLGAALDCQTYQINNLGAPTSGTDAATKTYVDESLSGLHWQTSVIDEVDFTAAEPAGPSTGDRYINTATGVSSVTAQSVTATYIYEWNGSSWTETVPEEGYALWIQDINLNKVYNGSAWVNFGSTISFLDLSDTPSSYTTANALYKVNNAGDAVAETLVTVSDAGTMSIPAGQTYQINSVAITFTDLTGYCGLAKGGTGIDASGATDGQLLIGGSSSNDLQLATLTEGEEVTITNGTNSITVDCLGKNYLIGGDFRVAPWQRGPSITAASTYPNDDDSYTADRWILLSDGNDIVDVSQISGGQLQATVQTANKKFGFLQVIENLNCQDIIGETVSVGVRLAATGNIDDIRIAVIAWDGAADTVTSDIISTWENASTNPTLVANWTYENTPSAITPTTSFVTYTVENISIDTASTTNVGVFVWTNVTDATGVDLLKIERVALTKGAVFTGFEPEEFGSTLHKCQRYFETSYNLADLIGSSQSRGVSQQTTILVNSLFSGERQFSALKRTTPTMTWYSYSTGASGNIRDITGGADVATTGSFGIGASATGTPTVAAVAVSHACGWHWVADVEL